MKGFTLFEVLVSVSIIAILLGAVYGAYVTNLEGMRHAQIRSDISQKARMIFKIMERDLSSAIIIKDGGRSYGMFKGIDGKIDDSEADSIRFSSLSFMNISEDQPKTDLSIIEYILKEGEEGNLALFRTQRIGLSEDSQPMEFWLTDNVSSLNFTYISEKGEEMEEWNTDEDELKGKIPVFIKVTLTLVDRNNAKHSFYLMIHPEISNKS